MACLTIVLVHACTSTRTQFLSFKMMRKISARPGATKVIRRRQSTGDINGAPAAHLVYHATHFQRQ